MKKICLWIGIIAAIIAIVFVGVGIIQKKTYNPKKPIATIKFEGYDKEVKIELDPQTAPNEVANFVKLANNGFYNDYKMTIDENEIASNADAQKAKLSNLLGQEQNNDYVYGIKGDIINNLIKHKKGVITMHRNDYSYFGYTEDGYNSANSKFGILTGDIDGYNQRYAAFGKVVEGMDVIESISATRVEEKEDENAEETTTESAEDTTDAEKEEKNVVKIQSISVDTFGVDYGNPEYNNAEEVLNKVNEVCQQYFGSDYESIFK